MSTFLYGAKIKQREARREAVKAAEEHLSTLESQQEGEPFTTMAAEQKNDLLLEIANAKGKEEGAEAAAEDNKYLSAVAALVPAEALAAHGLALALFTETTEDGTTITDSTGLTISFVALLGVTVILYFAGRQTFDVKDLQRVSIAVLAFAAWTVLIGTSAVTPLLGDSQDGFIPVAFLVGAGLVFWESRLDN